MFVRDRVYKHKNCLDMAIRVVAAYPCSEGYHLKVFYVSQRGGYLFHNRPEMVTVKRDQYPLWEKMAERARFERADPFGSPG